MASAKSFAVEFELATPIIMDRGINLAGILAKVIYDAGEGDPLSHVPLETVGGIFAGSDLFALGISPEYLVTYVRSLRPDKGIGLYMYHKSGGGNVPKKPIEKIKLATDNKIVLDWRAASGCRSVVAFGRGDMEAVRSLLAGVTHIGAKRSGDYGAVASITVAPTHNTHSGIADSKGNPTRAVPIAVWTELGLPRHPVRNLVARLPRWEAPREECVGPRHWEMAVDDFVTEIG